MKLKFAVQVWLWRPAPVLASVGMGPSRLAPLVNDEGALGPLFFTGGELHHVSARLRLASRTAASTTIARHPQKRMMPPTSG